MQYAEFLKAVQRRANLHSQDAALHATRVTLEVLIERLQGGEAKDFLSQLPQELVQSLRPIDTQGGSLPFGLNDFYRRVSERAGVNLEHAQQYVQAVMATLQEALSAGELQDMRSQLPQEFDPLFMYEGHGEIPARGY